MGVRFLKGPIPWPWLVAAMGLGGSALAVGVNLWCGAGLRRSRVVPLNLSRLAIGRGAASRGLVALQEAGLVRVHQLRGRKPLVTILNCVERRPYL